VVAAAAVTAEPVMTTRLALGDAVQHAPGTRRAAQTPAAPRTAFVVAVARLINGDALVERVHLVTHGRHELLQLTSKLLLVNGVFTIFVLLTAAGTGRSDIVILLTAFSSSINVFCLFIRNDFVYGTLFQKCHPYFFTNSRRQFKQFNL